MEPSSGARDVHQTCTRRGSREGLKTKQVPAKPGLASSRRAYQAERGGFEPPKGCDTLNGLANRQGIVVTSEYERQLRSSSLTAVAFSVAPGKGSVPVAAR